MNLYKIVIADDEQLERMLLQKTVEEHLGSQCMVKTAANGREAVEAAMQIQADMVLMDIEMPGINGLEASDFIFKELPDCHIIILTAYSEFKYAKKAIEIGVVEYLLKPCSDKELLTVIDDIADRINAERAKNQERERSVRQIKLLTTQIEEQLVLTVMGGDIHPQYILKKLKEQGIEFCNGVFAIVHAQEAMEDIGNLVKSDTWPKHIHPITYMYDGRLYILGVSDNPNTDCLLAVKKQLNKLSNTLRTLSGKILYVAYGDNFTHIEEAQQSCFQAQLTLGHCTKENPVCKFQEQFEEEEDIMKDPFMYSMLIGDQKLISQVTGCLIENQLARQLDWDVTVERIENLLFKSIINLQKETGISLPKFKLEEGQKNNKDQLYRAISAILLKISTHVAKKMGDRQEVHFAKIKKEIEEYIAVHYHEPLFLPNMAREMRYSSAYFSRLFRQCFQQNFILYLTEVRIEAAKDLLCTTNLNIKEIGERVGYSDSNYFTKVFRKATGKCPSEYKEEVLMEIDKNHKEETDRKGEEG